MATFPVSKQIYHAQILLNLESSKKYFATIRAITGAGNLLESCSNGMTIDTSPPEAQFDEVGSDDAVYIGDVIYQKQTDNLAASWNVTDTESGVTQTSVWPSKYPGIRL